jgi:hypothetical protein
VTGLALGIGGTGDEDESGGDVDGTRSCVRWR